MENNKAYLGIDVSKGYADFQLLDADEKILEENFQLPDHKEGRAQLLKLIQSWLGQGVTHLYCGVESTGGMKITGLSF